MKVAVIGIGSNSVRALMADVRGDTFERLWRAREGTRLFAGLDQTGNLGPESMEKTVRAVGQMAGEARERGAEQVNIFATSAARDAANGKEFMAAVSRAAGISLEIISGEEEAELSFLGAGAVARGVERIGVIDIGGGSTEIAVGSPKKIEHLFSCQMGAVRLWQRLRLERREDMTPVEIAASEILDEQLREITGFTPPEVWVGTGGTFTTLAAMVRKVPWTDRTNMHGMVISREEIRAIGEMLADMTPEERKQLPGLQPSRVDIVVHGICILLGVMRRLEIASVIVSEWGNLDGYIRKHCCIKPDQQAEE